MRWVVESVLGEHVAQVGEGAIEASGAMEGQQQQRGCEGPCGRENKQVVQTIASPTLRCCWPAGELQRSATSIASTMKRHLGARVSKGLLVCASDAEDRADSASRADTRVVSTAGWTPPEREPVNHNLNSPVVVLTGDDVETAAVPKDCRSQAESPEQENTISS